MIVEFLLFSMCTNSATELLVLFSSSAPLYHASNPQDIHSDHITSNFNHKILIENQSFI